MVSATQYGNLATTHCVPGVKKTKPANKDLVFGRQFTDHMLEIDVCDDFLDFGLICSSI
jgi:hypothetical protein